MCVKMEESKQTPSSEELLRRIQELEKSHIEIKQHISKLNGSSEPLAMKLTDSQYLNILHSIGQAIFIYDVKHRIIFWNRDAENIYGYKSGEAIGRSPTELLVEPEYESFSEVILQQTANGESWFGEFPIKNKSGERFVVNSTYTPYRDENRRLLGAMCLSSDPRLHELMKVGMKVNVPTGTDFNSKQPLQTSIASKISNLDLMKMKNGECDTDQEGPNDQSEGSTPSGHISSFPFDVFFFMETLENSSQILTKDCSCKMSENKPLWVCKVLSSKLEELMGKKGISWPLKGNETEVESLNAKLSRDLDLNCQLCENNNPTIKASGSFSLSMLHASNTNSTFSTSSDEISINSGNVITLKGETENTTDYDILWEDLIIKDQIGEGSYATVFHSLWLGSDVAVKLFKHQEYYDDAIVQFKQEVTVMKKLRHPNILLFMGAVTSHQHLCIVTEFLPRGSLYRILRRNTASLDWRRRIHMAMDIARGMNYLHHCKPPIVHCDLKSSNLLVDKNWRVKVGDFGLSRVKHRTYLQTNSGKGTPQWMAPEIIRNEQANEKSDVYSYGVVLWEIVTGNVPWDDLNPMQVIAAVGFMNRRLEIPENVDPLWATLIESCFSSDPHSRPTFQELLYKLKDLQKNFCG